MNKGRKTSCYYTTIQAVVHYVVLINQWVHEKFQLKFLWEVDRCKWEFFIKTVQI